VVQQAEAMSANKGRLEVGYTAWCGCGNWTRASGSRAECVRQFKRKGWTNTPDRGWSCPHCPGVLKPS
jgi:hypothetical protein